MSSPRIVVVMAAFNEAPYLDETIPAVLEQTMPDFRLLLLDNGSTDGSWPILTRFRDTDARVTLLRADTNLSPPDVTNLLVGVASALWRECRWIVAAGADDLMHSGYLEAILDAAAANPDANCIYSPVNWIGHPERGERRNGAFDPAYAADVCQIPAWRAITRELWDAVGPEDVAVGPGSDWSWIVRATAMGLLRPFELPDVHLSLRVREGGRITQSEEVDWPRLHGHLKWVAENVR